MPQAGSPQAKVISKVAPGPIKFFNTDYRRTQYPTRFFAGRNKGSSGWQGIACRKWLAYGWMQAPAGENPPRKLAN